ncbi:hypothetical protein [Lacibacter sediminis]|uniref:DUF4595 domain-containing protein n=1 Tax=Lacibacter sediminis TaxID=2760713 RepID=A0A7G5XIG2_9BACT|nr:hypothetical protein [Lacibacter sediminis]QNA45265.1 hypothetical protein H4075_03420 [Lacibacter sediminis]
MKLIVVSLAVTLLLLNCKKSMQVTEPKAELASNKLPATVVTGNGESSHFLYNAQGQLLAHTNGTAVHYYKPGSDHFLTLSNKASNSKIVYRNSQRDASGRIVKLTKYAEDEGESSIEFMYTDEGYLERQRIVFAGTTDVQEYLYYYTDGNLQKILEHKSQELVSTVFFEYDKKRRNAIKIDLFDIKQIGFVTDEQFGKQSRNLVKNVKAVASGEQTGVAFQYLYSSDSNDGIQSISIEANNKVLKKYNLIFL